MVLVRCPRCSTVVEAHGVRAECPGCGFAGARPTIEAARQPGREPLRPHPAAVAAPAHGAAEAAGQSPEAQRQADRGGFAASPDAAKSAHEKAATRGTVVQPRRRVSGIAVAALVLLFLVAAGGAAYWILHAPSGATDGAPSPPAVTAQQAAERLAAAHQTLAAFLATGTLAGYDTLQANATLYPAGHTSGPARSLSNVTITWGSDRVSRSMQDQYLLLVRNPANRHVARGIYCSAEARVETSMFTTALVARPERDPVDCVLNRARGDLLPYLKAWPNPSAANGTTAIHRDGRVSWNATAGPWSAALLLDPAGRLESLHIVDPASGTVAHLTFRSGAPAASITPPAGTRQAAPVSVQVVFRAGWWNATVLTVDADAPLTDFALEVRTTAAGKPAGPSLRVPVDGTAAGNFTGHLFDVDGNGLLSAGDRFVLHNPAWGDREEFAVSLVDTWAGASSVGI